MDEIRLLREEEVKRFEKYLKEMERAPATISKYLHDIRSFMRYRLGQNPYSCAEPVSKEDALGFKAFLIRDYQPQSVNSMLAALNSFFSCMGWSDLRARRSSPCLRKWPAGLLCADNWKCCRRISESAAGKN